MGVHSPNEQIGSDGLGESLAAHIESHESNTKQLLNLAEGRKKTDPRPVYDPSHPDNHWPQMVHHPAKGELTVGKSLKGVTAPFRANTAKANEAEKEAAFRAGYRSEPYIKPQIAVLDAASEKAAMAKEIEQLKGANNVLSDQFAQLMARLDKKDKE